MNTDSIHPVNTKGNQLKQHLFKQPEKLVANNIILFTMLVIINQNIC